MAKTTQIEMYPELSAKGSFNLSPELSVKIREIYELVDATSVDDDAAEMILDEYNSGYLKAIEEILSVPIGKFEETMLKMLTEVHTNMQTNYDAVMSDIDDSKPDPEVVERVMTEINQAKKDNDTTVPVETVSNDDEDISDEEMMKILPNY